MSKFTKNENGFSGIEILMVVVIVALIGAVGYMVYKNKHQPTKVVTVTKTVVTPAQSNQSTTQDSKFVNVIQKDNSVTQSTPENIAKTPDQISILRALHDSCAGQSDTNVTVNVVVFDGSTNFRQDGSHAVINAGVCDPVAKTIDVVSGDGSDRYLHQNSSGTWIFDASSAGLGIECAKVDGLGYPTSIIPTCYDSTTSKNRALN